MEKRTLLIIGLISGILATVGVFLPWVSDGGVRVSGWDGLSHSVSEALDVLLVLIGGIIALVGGLVAVYATKAKSIYHIISLGGVLAIWGWLWFYVSRVDVPSFWSHVSIGYFMCLVGGVLAIIGGVIGGAEW